MLLMAALCTLKSAVQGAKIVMHRTQASAIINAMEDNRLKRLLEVLERDPRSPNRISEDARLGRNYVRTITKDGKMPKLDHFDALLNTMSYQDKMYVLIGQRLTEQDLEFVRILADLSPEARRHAVDFFRALAEPADS
ncbi:hypothetical protein [Pacificoceanicola onchidii]|uniref:hypothetical protein n=1 Tax=Pacificoceanicola onchidii TaxID=2562685 RepID=UPI0010A458FF|nr:hypothetical protein [Pacificoceanicola onchidii]